MPPNFINFVKKHHVLTLATSQEGISHCANVFYAFLETPPRFVFASHNDTLHIRHICLNRNAAASIYFETSVLKKIQGLQMRGIVFLPDANLQKNIYNRYVKSFPYAVLSSAPLWIFEPIWAKFTDNRACFGTKTLWEQNLD